MVRLTISTTIDPKLHEIIKQKGFKVSELIAIGLNTRLGMPQLTKRLGVTEQELQNLVGKYRNLAQKNYVLEQKLEEMRQKYEN